MGDVLWLRSPIQSAGETEKVVGFPVVPRDLRQQLKAIPFDGGCGNWEPW